MRSGNSERLDFAGPSRQSAQLGYYRMIRRNGSRGTVVTGLEGEQSLIVMENGQRAGHGTTPEN